MPRSWLLSILARILGSKTDSGFSSEDALHTQTILTKLHTISILMVTIVLHIFDHIWRDDSGSSIRLEADKRLVIDWLCFSLNWAFLNVQAVKRTLRHLDLICIMNISEVFIWIFELMGQHQQYFLPERLWTFVDRSSDRQYFIFVCLKFPPNFHSKFLRILTYSSVSISWEITNLIKVTPRKLKFEWKELHFVINKKMGNWHFYEIVYYVTS